MRSARQRPDGLLQAHLHRLAVRAVAAADPSRLFFPLSFPSKERIDSHTLHHFVSFALFRG
jgi:hypothetical protein